MDMNTPHCKLSSIWSWTKFPGLTYKAAVNTEGMCTHAGGGSFHHTPWVVWLHAAHPRGCLAVQETLPSEIKAPGGAWGCTRWWEDPLLNKRMPLQRSQCPQLEAGLAAIVQNAFCSLIFAEAVLLSEPLKKLQGHFFLVLSKMQFPFSSYRVHLIILQGTNKFNCPNELILDLHSWLQIHFKYTLRMRNRNVFNFGITFFQGAQKSSPQLYSLAYINN